MLDVKAGDKVRVAEYDDLTRTPRPDGKVVAAEVTAVTKLYVFTCDTEGARGQFWRESGWTAWDGAFHWRLEVSPTCPDGGTCHHLCPSAAECFRVRCCGPLSGVYPDDRWPDDIACGQADEDGQEG